MISLPIIDGAKRAKRTAIGMRDYDITVIGGGAAGMMAAICAGRSGKRVCLIERNTSLGKKVMITGKGRCNITNTASVDKIIEKFGRGGEFLRTALFAFSAEDLVSFFRTRGVELKAERQGRVFPVSNRAHTIVNALEAGLEENDVDVVKGVRITDVKMKGNGFSLYSEDDEIINSGKVILATGGVSFAATGSSGDGFSIARRLGHCITPLKPGLVPMRTKESWVKDLQGLSLDNVRAVFRLGKKSIVSDVGDIMFTHFGVSGPLILDMSGRLVSELDERKEIRMDIDLKPGLTKEQVEARIIREISARGNIRIKSFMQGFLPKSMIGIFLEFVIKDQDKRTSQLSREERRGIVELLKAFPVTLVGSLPTDAAMVTMGGVSIKDINPRTMESKITAGLYFAGEIIEGGAPSGGYNLQQAFSTGYLAGEKCAEKRGQSQFC